MVTITPSRTTYRVGERVDVIVTGLGASGDSVSLFLINGLDPDLDLSREELLDAGGNCTFSGVVIPSYGLTAQTNTFKALNNSTSAEDVSGIFSIIPAPAPKLSLSLSTEI